MVYSLHDIRNKCCKYCLCVCLSTVFSMCNLVVCRTHTCQGGMNGDFSCCKVWEKRIRSFKTDSHSSSAELASAPIHVDMISVCKFNIFRVPCWYSVLDFNDLSRAPTQLLMTCQQKCQDNDTFLFRLRLNRNFYLWSLILGFLSVTNIQSNMMKRNIKNGQLGIRIVIERETIGWYFWCRSQFGRLHHPCTKILSS